MKDKRDQFVTSQKISNFSQKITNPFFSLFFLNFCAIGQFVVFLNTLASSLNNLAALHYALEDLSEAKKLYQESINIKQVVLGKSHPSVATALNNLAGLMLSTNDLTNDFTDARTMYEESLRIRTDFYGPEHALVAESYNNLGLLLLAQGSNLEDAKEMLVRAVSIKTAVHGATHPSVSISVSAVAEVLQIQGFKEESLKLYQRALDIRIHCLGEQHPDTQLSKERVDQMQLKISDPYGVAKGVNMHRLTWNTK